MTALIIIAAWIFQPVLLQLQIMAVLGNQIFLGKVTRINQAFADNFPSNLLKIADNFFQVV